jgi:hypothetical protein
MINLGNVSLIAVATQDIDATCKALDYSCKGINFSSIKLISSADSLFRPRQCTWIPIRPFTSVNDWGRFVIYDLHKHIDSEFILLIHADGFVVNPSMWREEFLNYDYIGAPWPIPKDRYSYRDIYGNIIRVGNSVSIRSLRMLQAPSKLRLTWAGDNGFYHEDGFLSVQNRHVLTEYGLRFAPLSIAVFFSREYTIPENRNIAPFAFHKWHGKNKCYPCFTNRNGLRGRLKQLMRMLSAITWNLLNKSYKGRY